MVGAWGDNDLRHKVARLSQVVAPFLLCTMQLFTRYMQLQHDVVRRSSQIVHRSSSNSDTVSIFKIRLMIHQQPMYI